MKFDDGLGLRQKFNLNRPGPNWINVFTISAMKISKRWPIPETLLNKPENYELHIDSVMHETYEQESCEKWYKYKPKLKAPPGSDNEEGFLDFYYSTDAEPPEDTGPVVVKVDPMARYKQIDSYSTVVH